VAAHLAGESENWSFTIDGRPVTEAATPTIMVRHVSPGYLETMRVRLLEGRTLDAYDRPGSERVIVISQAMATTFWPGERAIDKHIRFRGPELLAAQIWRVIGIADDVPASGLDAPPKPTVYLTCPPDARRASSPSSRCTRSDPSGALAAFHCERAHGAYRLRTSSMIDASAQYTR
jgi:hypothetical protein